MAYELRPISDLDGWYETEMREAFPPNELKPLETMKGEREAGYYEILGLYDGPTLLGYATLWSRPEVTGWVLLDYLGVTAARRGGGLGGEILRRLVERLPEERALLVEAESPVPGDGEAENALRRRRIGFYARNGFTPVYEMAACGARFQAFVSGTPPEDLSAMMVAHKEIYGPDRVDVVVPLAEGEAPPPSCWG